MPSSRRSRPRPPSNERTDTRRGAIRRRFRAYQNQAEEPHHAGRIYSRVPTALCDRFPYSRELLIYKLIVRYCKTLCIVSLKRSKSIDRLYHEVDDYDLVVVPDSPLADALNRRLERPHFGPFAITPRRLATRRREAAEDRTAFLEVIDETDLGWKEIAYTVGNVLQCWEYRGSADAILEYDAFDTPATRTVVDLVSSLQTSSRLLADYEIDVGTDGSVAVDPPRRVRYDRSVHRGCVRSPGVSAVLKPSESYMFAV